MVMRILVGLLVGVITSAGVACGPPYRFVLTDDEGEQIRVSLFRQIITSEYLTDEQKREHLRNIGLTDELFIEMLINHPDAFREQEADF